MLMFDFRLRLQEVEVNKGRAPSDACAPCAGVAGPLSKAAQSYIACFNAGDALKRTVLPAFTLIGSPVPGLRAVQALVFVTRKLPKPGRVKPPVFFISRMMASTRSSTTRFEVLACSSALS